MTNQGKRMVNENLISILKEMDSKGISIAELAEVLEAFANDEVQAKLTAGDNITIEDGVISATDTTYTAGDNITIEDGVISASGGDVWESVIGITFMSRITYFRLFTKEEITSSNLLTIINAELTSKYIDVFIEGGNLPEISGNKVLPLAVSYNGSSFSLTYLNITGLSTSSASIAYSSSNIFIQYSHKLN